MLAIGGVYLSELAIPGRLYEAASVLLHQVCSRTATFVIQSLTFEVQHTIDTAFKPDMKYELWPLQTVVLMAQFGSFNKYEPYQHQAHHQISIISAVS